MCSSDLFLDITASHENRGIMLDVVRRTAEACFMPLTVGGGVRTIEDIRALLTSGADKVSINTAAVSRRAFVKEAAEKFGDQCIVVAIDAKKVSQPGEPDRWEIFTHGGRNPTGIDAIAYAREVVALGAGEILLTSMDRDGKVAVEGWAKISALTAVDIARRFEDAGVAAIIYTDVNRDGMLEGLNLDATIALADKISVPVIASGGLASLADVRALLAPRAQKLAGAIAGRALYDGRLDAAAALALLRDARATA